MAFRIEHRIGIRAPAPLVWAFIADLPGWSGWNPIYPRAEGQIRIGDKLDLTLHLEGEADRQIAPRILDWEPDAQLVWRLDLVPMLAYTVRYMEIEALAETGCVFNNGEFFHGMLGERVGMSKRRAILAGFTAMGESLKAMAEAKWNAEQRDGADA